jgi:hypothetical protein
MNGLRRYFVLGGSGTGIGFGSGVAVAFPPEAETAETVWLGFITFNVPCSAFYQLYFP